MKTEYYLIDHLDDCRIYKSYMTVTDKYIIEFKEDGYITSILWEFVDNHIHIITLYRKGRNYHADRYIAKYYNNKKITTVMNLFK